FSPLFLGLALHCWRFRVLELQPVLRPAGAVARAKPLRDDTLKAHLAGVGEDGWAVAFHVFIEPDAGAGLGYDRRKRGLANLKRITPDIVAVLLDQIEGVEEYAFVSALVPDEIERGNAVVIAGNSFAIDDAGARAQACQRLNNQWE